MPRKPLEIELPCCDKCGNVGAMVSDSRRGVRFACTGPTKEPHSKTAMVPRKFREVLPESEAQS